MRLDADLIELQRGRDRGDDDAAAEQYERYDDFHRDAIEALCESGIADLPSPLRVALKDWYRTTYEYRTQVAAIHAVMTARPDGL